MDKIYASSHLFNKRGGWNKHGGGAKVAKLLNMEVGINVEGGFLIFGGWNFLKSVSVDSTFIRKMRVMSSLLNWFHLVCRIFGQSNMHSTQKINFCSDPLKVSRS